MAEAPHMVFLGFGKYVRSDRIFAIEPLRHEDRRSGARTRVRAHRGHDGALRPRRHDRLRDPLHPDAGARAVPALALTERFERVDLVCTHVLAETEEDHPGRFCHPTIIAPQRIALRSASTTRS